MVLYYLALYQKLFLKCIVIFAGLIPILWKGRIVVSIVLVLSNIISFWISRTTRVNAVYGYHKCSTVQNWIEFDTSRKIKRYLK